MSDTSVSTSSTGAGFNATQSTSTPINSNSSEPTGLPEGYGGRFFDSDDGPVASTKTPAATLSDLGEASESAGEIADEVQEATTEGSKDTSKAKPKAKTYKVTAGGKTVDLPLDAKFTVPVDGKNQAVSINDLVSNYNGKISYDKRFTELDKNRKEFTQQKSAHEADKQSLNDGLGQFFQLVQAKRGPQAWAHLIKMAGLEGQYSLKDLRKEVYEQEQSIRGMSPEQRAAMEAQEERDFYKSEFEGITNRDNAQKAQAQAEQALEQVLDSHSITRDMFGQYHDQLTKGGISADNITPELVIDYHKRIDAYTAIRQAAEKVDPSILKDEKVVARLRDFKLANPDMTPADISDVIKTWKGDSRARKLSEKVRQTQTATSASVRAPTPVRKTKAVVTRSDEDFFF